MNTKKDEALKLALEALEKVTTEMLALKDELAERGARPTTNVFHQRLWDSAFKSYTDHALPAAAAIRSVLNEHGEALAAVPEAHKQPAQINWNLIYLHSAMEYIRENHPQVYAECGDTDEFRADRLKELEQPAQQQEPREHETSEHCWCHPTLDYKDPDTGNEVWVHNEPH